MDYKHRFPDNRFRSGEKKSRAGLWAILTVVVISVAAAVGWTLAQRAEDPKPPVQTGKPTEKTDASPVTLPDPSGDAKPGAKKPVKSAKDGQKPVAEATPAAAPKPEPRFTFYKILPEKEAIIPESEIKNLKQAESQSKKPQPGQYLLQAGSFANPQDAVKLKEKLTALKIKSHIENVKIENTAWNRVKIGPFTSLADADKVRTYLHNNQLDSIVQKAVTKAPQAPAKH